MQFSKNILEIYTSNRTESVQKLSIFEHSATLFKNQMCESKGSETVKNRIAILLNSNTGKVVVGAVLALSLASCTMNEKVQISVNTETVSPLVKGEANTYVMEVSNVGRITATSVNITPKLPEGVILSGKITSNSGNWDCSSAACSHIGDFTAGSTDKIFIPVNVSIEGKQIKPFAKLMSNQPD